MGDAKEWYMVAGDRSDTQHPNLEAACDVAHRLAAGTSDAVEVLRCTTEVVRCFKRQVSVIETDLTAAADNI